MPFYESVFIARQDISVPQVDSLTEELTNLIAEQGAKVVKMEYWGLRSLAYKIRQNRKGHFVLYVRRCASTSISVFPQGKWLAPRTAGLPSAKCDQGEIACRGYARGFHIEDIRL